MIRAGVFIGVGKAGNLRQLRDAAAGAERMHAWALEQGIEDQVAAKLITDAGGRTVTPDEIYHAIKEIIDGPGADQLIVYFAGHGVNISRNEQWLLTEAPVRTSAAVDVTSSVELARYCGIQHVVIVSDACRVAPEGIQAQNVRGIDIFPNDGAGDRARPVDQFYACLLGRTAAEIKDAGTAASNYTALYTQALLDGLSGQQLDLLELSGVADDPARYVKARRLEKYLEREVPLRVKALRLENKVNQNPDAIITSDREWLSRIEIVGRRGAPHPGGGPPAGPPDGAAPTLREAVRDLTHTAVEGDERTLHETINEIRSDVPPVGTDFARTVDTVVRPFGPDRFETHCGIKVRGARIFDAFAPRASVTLLGGLDAVRVDRLQEGAASVLVELHGGFGVVVPVLAEFIAGLTFDEGELVDMAYEPSANSWRWSIFERKAEKLRTLRAIAASSSQHGRFQLDRDEAGTVARRMQLEKGYDPTFAVYAAYAYHDLQEIKRIQDMSDYLYRDLGVRLFDLELLGRRLVDTSADLPKRVVPFVPLLSQGWALLRAHRFRLHPALHGIERTMLDSVWSVYGPDGVGRLKEALATGGVR
jgi:hypothetical protein